MTEFKFLGELSNPFKISDMIMVSRTIGIQASVLARTNLLQLK